MNTVINNGVRWILVQGVYKLSCQKYTVMKSVLEQIV